MRIPWPQSAVVAGLSAKAEGLALADHTADNDEERARVEHDRALFLQRENFQRLVTLKQIHSTTIFEASPSSPCWNDRRMEGDGLYTTQKGVLIGVFTADCVPVLISGTTGNGLPVVAAIHAGWRGVASGITERMVERLSRETGMNTGDCRIWIGPHIRQCCYEVGEEFHEYFDSSFFHGKYLALESNLLSSLQGMGIPANHIRSDGSCTRCDADNRYYSYRNGEKKGRMLSYIGIPG